MSLSTQCGVLVDKLDQRRKFEMLQRKGHRLQTRRRKLQEAVTEVVPPFKSWKALTESEIAVDCPKERAGALYQDITRQYKEFRRDPSSLIEGEDINQALAELKAIGERLEERVLQAWERYTSEQVISIDDQLLQILRAIPGFGEPIQRLRALRSNVDRLRRMVPKTAEDVRVFNEQAAELRGVWGQLNSDHIPPEVMVFLRNAGSRGASLDLVTPAVLEWLRARKLGNAFHVFPRQDS